MATDKHLIALTHFLPFGPVCLAKLNGLGSWQAAWQASLRTLAAIGLEEKIAADFISWRAHIKVDELAANLARQQITTVALTEKNYPPLLKEIFQPPPLLYYQGDLSCLKNQPTLAVVGSRRASHYGQQAVDYLVKDLAGAGLTIVSGLAFGIDALAHQAALDAGGRTVGVLGSGLDRPNFYPLTNWALAQKMIARGGAVISEFPPGTHAEKFNFPRRNRLISGLSLGILVVEAAAKSGSLITAHYGLEQNREVLAIPGNIFSGTSAGTNHLLKLGAKIVTKAEDVLIALRLEKTLPRTAPALVLNETEAALAAVLNHEPKHVNELKILLNLDISVITGTLTLMEIKGLVKNIGSMSYVKNF